MRPITLRPLLLAAALVMAPTFAPASAAPFDSIEASTEQTLATYQKVYIAPVEITLETPNLDLLTSRRRSSYQGSQTPVSDEDQARKAADLHTQLTRSFAEHYTIVDAPAGDVLVISAEITKLLASRPTPEQRRRGVGSLSFGSSVSAGGVDYTVQIGSADEVFYNIQEDYRSNLNDSFPRTSVWQDADDSFRRFSRQLVRFVRNN